MSVSEPLLSNTCKANCCCCSVAKSYLTFCDPMDCRGLCPPLFPGVYSNSCPLSWWCYPTISSSVFPFSSCLQSFPTSGSFLISWLFTSGGQSIGASASASVLLMNIQVWFPLGLTGLIFLAEEGMLKRLPSSQFESINFSALSLLYGPTRTSVHDYYFVHNSLIIINFCPLPSFIIVEPFFNSHLEGGRRAALQQSLVYRILKSHWADSVKAP